MNSSIVWFSTFYTIFSIFILYATKVAAKTFKIPLNFRSIAAVTMQVLLIVIGWFVLVTNPRNYALAACLNTACHLIQEILVVKSYQKQSGKATVLTLAFAWFTWPHYLGFNFFATMNAMQFSDSTKPGSKTDE